MTWRAGCGDALGEVFSALTASAGSTPVKLAHPRVCGKVSLAGPGGSLVYIGGTVVGCRSPKPGSLT